MPRQYLMPPLLALLLAGCAVTPEYQRPAVELPDAWENAAVVAAARAEADWWAGFGSAELERLLAQALEDNRDLAIALSRIEQARASARVAGAASLPRVEGRYSASRDYRDDGRGGSGDQARLTASYELDLWGANRARRQAARAAVVAREHDHAALALLLQAEVASHYLDLAALHDREAIAQQNLAAARELLRLVERRYQVGAAGGLELSQQRAAVANLEAQLPVLQQQLASTRNALAVLLGRPPQGFAPAPASLGEMELPALAAGQPAALLERRPDIRRAEAELIAAHADIGIARAAFFPITRLTADGIVSGVLTSGASTVASLAASIAGPVFDGGRLQGGVQLSEARREELVQRYGQTVLTSLREVEDALAAEAASVARMEALQRAVAESREAYRLATVRYEAGSVDLLTLLDAQRGRLQAEDGLVQARLARYTATVNLFRALGGGWEGA